MNFYNYYLSLCAKSGMKPSPAGEAIGVSRTAVNGWKKGRLPTDSTLHEIASFFDVPIASFWECDDIKERDAKAQAKRKEDDLGKKNTATNGDGNADYFNSEIRSYLNQLFDQLSVENQLRAVEKLQELKLEQLTQDFPKAND